jgi:hypothetical protein
MENKETLASALCKAQSEFTPAAQSGYNPHFKSSFSTMTDLLRATRPALKKYGIAVSQYPLVMNNGTHVLKTHIMFGDQESDIWSDTPIVLKDPTDMQAFGKACSYITRYVYKMMLGIEAADECEDDGNESAGVTTNYASNNAISDKQLSLLKMLLKEQPGRESALLLHYKIDDLSKLSWKYMNEVVAALKPKE